MIKSKLLLYPVIAVLLTLAGCSDYYHLTKQKSTATPAEKKEAGMKYYEEGDYIKAARVKIFILSIAWRIMN